VAVSDTLAPPATNEVGPVMEVHTDAPACVPASEATAVSALAGATPTLNGNAVVAVFVAKVTEHVEPVQPATGEPFNVQAKVVVFAHVAVYVWVLAVADTFVGPPTAVHADAPVCTTATLAVAAVLLAGATCTV